MHGLINKAFQGFVTDSYGEGVWTRVVEVAGLHIREFETLAEYPDEVLSACLKAASAVLDREVNELAEDAGSYLVTHPNTSSVRRLLRFGGADFTEFLHSLDDLPDRARLAVSGLEIPRLSLTEPTPNAFVLECGAQSYPAGHFMIGILRAMADDYGALALLDYQGRNGDCETIGISVPDAAFAMGRSFHLAGPEAAE